MGAQRGHWDDPHLPRLNWYFCMPKRTLPYFTELGKQNNKLNEIFFSDKPLCCISELLIVLLGFVHLITTGINSFLCMIKCLPMFSVA